MSKQEFGTPLSRTATGSTSASAAVSGVPGVRYYITDLQASSDLATGAVLQVLDGSTVIWQGVAAGPSYFEHTFSTPLRCSSGATATVTISGAAAAAANFAGFSNNS